MIFEDYVVFQEGNIKITKEMLTNKEIEIAVNEERYLKKENNGLYKVLSYVIPSSSLEPSSDYIFGSVIIAEITNNKKITRIDAEFLIVYDNNNDIWIIKTCIIHDNKYFDIIKVFNKQWAGKKDRIELEIYFTREDGKIFVGVTYVFPKMEITDLKSEDVGCVQGFVELYPNFYWLEKKPPEKILIKVLFCFYWSDYHRVWVLKGAKPITKGWYEGIVHL